jgi:hypothetical protein
MQCRWFKFYGMCISNYWGDLYGSDAAYGSYRAELSDITFIYQRLSFVLQKWNARLIAMPLFKRQTKRKVPAQAAI